MFQKLTIEEAERRFPEMVKGQTWITARTKYKFRCAIHGVYKQWFDNYRRGHHCQRCGFKTISEKQSSDIKSAEKRCPAMLKGQTWRGVNVRYEFRCSVHGIYKQFFSVHVRGSRCRKCANKARGLRQRLTVQEVERRHPDMVKGQKWRGTSFYYRYVCPVHGIYTQSFLAHHHGSRCARCAGRGVFNIKDAESRFPDMVKGQKWAGVRRRYRFLCGKHGVYPQVFYVHLNCGCPTCGESKGEKGVATILAKLHLPFEREKQFKTCRNINPLSFDFYIPSLRTLIEFHGGQHYFPVKWFGGRRALQKTQHRDRIKKRWARKNGLKFITVCYRAKNIETYLIERLRPEQRLAA